MAQQAEGSHETRLPALRRDASSPQREIGLVEAQAAYDILVEIAGAPEGGRQRDEFVRGVTHSGMREFPFGGKLGRTGRFRNGGIDGVPHLWCEPDRLDDRRAAIIAVANARIRVLFGAGFVA